MSDQVSKTKLTDSSTTVEEARQAIHRILEIIAARIAQEIMAEHAQRASRTGSVSVTRLADGSEP